MIFDEVTFKVITYLSTNVAIAIANTTNQYSVKRPQVTNAGDPQNYTHGNISIPYGWR